jgi:uncharacterized protein YggE
MRPSKVAMLLGTLVAVALPARADMGRRLTTMQSASGVGVPSRAVEAPRRVAEASRREIDVTGYATISAKPDDMIVSFSVNSRAPTADECTREQSAKTNKIVDTLKAMAGAGAQVHTSNFSMSPYSVPLSGTATATPSAGSTPQPAQIWIFTGDVTAFADSLITIGKLIDAGTAAGATGIAGSGFDVEPGQMVVPPAVGAATASNQRLAPRSAQPVYLPRPEKPFISMRVQVTCGGASECVRRGSRILDRVQQALIDVLGSKNDVRLSSFQLNERPNQQRYGYQPPGQYPMRQEFQAHVTVSIESRELQKLGELIEAGISAGADQLNSVQFTLRDDAAARNQAIAQAAEDAKGKAAVVAKSMGVQLGDVIQISTNASVQPQTIYGPSFSASLHRAEPVRPMPVQPHEVGFTAQVTVTYAIK